MTRKRKWMIGVSFLFVFSFLFSAGAQAGLVRGTIGAHAESGQEAEAPKEGAEEGQEMPEGEAEEEFVPASPAYTVEPDFSNVINWENFSYMSDQGKKLLQENGFAITEYGDREFFEQYEFNRYDLTPSFVTVDSMMHTYHLFFAYLMRTTEKKEIRPDLEELIGAMYRRCLEEDAILEGSDWEEAAHLNLAFFAVANALISGDDTIGDAKNDWFALGEEAQEELSLVLAAEDVLVSPLFGGFEDYSQYKPRGNYEGDPELETYFRAMMWLGRRNFAQKDEKLDRCALLQSLAIRAEGQEKWSAIYDITSFFAGSADDSVYYDYLPAILEAYGDDITTDELPLRSREEFETYHALTAKIEAPKINSVPTMDEPEVDKLEEARGYRFMGQRYTLDAEIFQQLVYSKLEPRENEDKRMLPSALDVPAALGSDEALAILEEYGDIDYPNYDAQMEKLREKMPEAVDAMAEDSLYAGWLYTLDPLLDPKGEGYPAFMQNDAWTRKSLEGYLGSYTELKHDTILYAKQIMAEMGGGWEEDVDDRGYVEPEPEVFARLAALTKKTKEGLAGYEMLSERDGESLERLQELAEQLETIAVKELTGELPTDEEFELIRGYGGTLEHFWEEALQDKESSYGYYTSEEFPAALVADIATDPNGYCLEVGIGGCQSIYVIVPVDGILRIAVGSVFSFYEFEQPLSERLTDTEWRIMQGLEWDGGPNYYVDEETVARPEWADGYRFGRQ